jgi:hypothetical protein
MPDTNKNIRFEESRRLLDSLNFILKLTCIADELAMEIFDQAGEHKFSMAKYIEWMRLEEQSTNHVYTDILDEILAMTTVTFV